MSNADLYKRVADFHTAAHLLAINGVEEQIIEDLILGGSDTASYRPFFLYTDATHRWTFFGWEDGKLTIPEWLKDPRLIEWVQAQPPYHASQTGCNDGIWMHCLKRTKDDTAYYVDPNNLDIPF